MIESITIEGLRGIRRGELTGLRPLTVLTGPNGSGKSTILDALLLGVAADLNGAVVTTTSRRGSETGRWLFGDQGVPTATLGATCRDASGSRELRRILQWDAAGQDAGALRWCEAGDTDRQGAVRYTGSADPRTSGQRLESGLDVHLYDTAQPTNLMLLYRRVFERRKKRSVIEQLAPLVPGLQDMERLPSGSGEEIFLGLSEVGLPARLAGDGVFAALQLSLVLGFSDASVVLLEEPELFLHPRSLPAVASVVVSAVAGGRQVVLSTHSLEFIDALLAQLTDYAASIGREHLAVFNVALKGGVLRVGETGGVEADAARETLALELR